jgi:hypothetical protein
MKTEREARLYEPSDSFAAPAQFETKTPFHSPPEKSLTARPSITSAFRSPKRIRSLRSPAAQALNEFARLNENGLE